MIRSIPAILVGNRITKWSTESKGNNRYFSVKITLENGNSIELTAERKEAQEPLVITKAQIMRYLP